MAYTPVTISALATDILKALADPSAQIWSSTTAQDAITRTLQDLLAYGIGAHASQDLTSDGTDTLDISSLTDAHLVTDIEYPTDTEPPTLREFYYSGTAQITIVGDPPTAGDTVRVHYITTYTAVPHRILPAVRYGAMAALLNARATELSETANVDRWVFNRITQLAKTYSQKYHDELDKLVTETTAPTVNWST